MTSARTLAEAFAERFPEGNFLDFVAGLTEVDSARVGYYPDYNLILIAPPADAPNVGTRQLEGEVIEMMIRSLQEPTP